MLDRKVHISVLSDRLTIIRTGAAHVIHIPESGIHPKESLWTRMREVDINLPG